MIDDSRIKDIVYKRLNAEPIFNDADAIKSCKNEQSRDIIDNSRLGGYDRFGNYVIIPDIKRELISMPKIIYNVRQEGKNTIYDMKSTIPIFGDVFFKLEVSNGEAVLVLCETVKREANGYLETYNEIIDSIPLGNGGLPQDIVFRNYNIKESPDDFGKGLKFFDYNNILTRKVYLSLLSKELHTISKVDEQLAFNKMISTLKSSGEYGKRVLTNFVERMKDRPSIYDVENTTKYTKAVNEVLLSSLEVATTQQDKDNFENKQAYLSVLNARNKNIDKYLDEANSKIDTKYIDDLVKKAKNNFENNLDSTQDDKEFFDKLKETTPTKRVVTKPVLKQGKESEKEKKLSKEDKIKAILNKKKQDEKKTDKNKKLKPAKNAKKAQKLKSNKKKAVKGKTKKKKPSKPKLKKKKKKFSKAKSPKKAKKRFGGKFKGKSKKKKFGKGPKKRKLPKGKLKKKKKKVFKPGGPQKAKGKVGNKLSSTSKKKKKNNGPDKTFIARLFVNKYFDKQEDPKPQIKSVYKEDLLTKLQKVKNTPKDNNFNYGKISQLNENPLNLSQFTLNKTENNNENPLIIQDKSQNDNLTNSYKINQTNTQINQDANQILNFIKQGNNQLNASTPITPSNLPPTTPITPPPPANNPIENK